ALLARLAGLVGPALTTKGAASVHFGKPDNNAATLIVESCAPGNGAFDPGETETVTFVVKNISGGAISNVKASLVPVAGSVTFVSGQQVIGDMAKDATANVTFTFLTGASCGSQVSPVLHITSGSNDTPTDEGDVTYGPFA